MRRWLARGVALVGHALAVVAVAAIAAYPFVEPAVLKAGWTIAEHGLMVEVWTYYLALHVGLGAAIWATIYLLFSLYRARKREASPRLVEAQGSVMVETLIVLPVALLLIFGLCQLIVINLAGALSNVAAFQATRTAWIWESEREAERMGMKGLDEQKVETFAKVQAASVLTPVAPGVFMQNPQLSGRPNSARATFFTAQQAFTPTNAGKPAMGEAQNRVGLSQKGGQGNRATGLGLSIVQALDPSTFRGRTARKFTAAYHAIDIEFQRDTSSFDKEQVGVTMHYYQLCAFPLVGRLFGQLQTRSGRQGFYKHIERTIMRDAQPDAHVVAPDSSWPEWSSSVPERPLYPPDDIIVR